MMNFHNQYFLSCFFLMTSFSFSFGQSFTLNTQADVDAFDTSLTSISGNITIETILNSDPIVDLSNLMNLTEIDGSLSMYNNTFLTNVDGFSNLNSILGCLMIHNNNALMNVDGFSSISQVSVDLNIEDNNALSNVDGFSSLTQIGGSLIIHNNNALTNVDGFSGLTQFGGNLSIEDNDALSNVDGFSSLTQFGTGLCISGNNTLSNVDGFSSITQIEASLTIYNNNALTNVDGFFSLAIVGIGFQMYNNPNLTNCCGVQDLLSTPNAIGGNIIIYNNPFACSSESEILAEPCNIIAGSIYHDDNLDCELNSLDNKLNFWKVKVEGDNYTRIKETNNLGDFKFRIPFGDYTISSQAINFNWELCESSYDITVDEENAYVNQDFQAKALTNCAELELDFSTPFLRRCFNNYYSIRVRNTGPASSAGTTLTLELDSFFEFISATIPYTQIDDSTLEFDLGVLALNEEVTFNIHFYLSCDATFGIEHCLSGELSDANLCVDSESLVASSYTECQENIGSYDPNDKRTFNEAGVETSSIEKDEYIYYHIRFQNTGTDTAFTVRVVDPLSPILDLNTLEMLSSSHAYSYEITDGPDLVVLFENILLVDSTTNEPASNGFFKFKVKPLPEYDYGTIIPNEAAIYFDFNEAVLTNEAIIVIESAVGIKEAEGLIDFNIFPNPTNNTLNLIISEKDINRIDSYEIVNQLGQIISSQTNLTKNNLLNVAELNSGIYNLVLKENGVTIGMKKFVKL